MGFELKDKNILVTGASGFIGSHLTEALVNLGAKVRVFVRYTSSGRLENLELLPQEILERLEIIRGDLRNLEGVKRAVKGSEVIFHLGALISIPYSYIDPRDFIDTNVVGTLNVLKAAQEFNVKKILITSTSEVYGTAIKSPISEEHPLQAQSPYAASKISADKIAESFYKTYNLPIVIVRPFNTYGPRQSMRAVIPTIIYQALKGDKLNIGSLEPKRDFTFVKDIAEGFIRAAESDYSIGQTINIGSGKAISIADLVKKIGSILGKELIVSTDEEKVRPEKSEVQLLLCDNSKAKKLLEWKPRIEFEEGLRDVIDYIKNNTEKYELERGNL